MRRWRLIFSAALAARNRLVTDWHMITSEKRKLVLKKYKYS